MIDIPISTEVSWGFWVHRKKSGPQKKKRGRGEGGGGDVFSFSRCLFLFIIISSTKEWFQGSNHHRVSKRRFHNPDFDESKRKKKNSVEPRKKIFNNPNSVESKKSDSNNPNSVEPKKKRFNKPSFVESKKKRDSVIQTPLDPKEKRFNERD